MPSEEQPVEVINLSRRPPYGSPPPSLTPSLFSTRSRRSWHPHYTCKSHRPHTASQSIPQITEHGAQRAVHNERSISQHNTVHSTEHRAQSTKHRVLATHFSPQYRTRSSPCPAQTAGGPPTTPYCLPAPSCPLFLHAWRGPPPALRARAPPAEDWTSLPASREQPAGKRTSPNQSKRDSGCARKGQ